MLSLKPADLDREISTARTHIAKFLTKRADLIAKLQGRYYRDDVAPEAEPENYAFTWKSFIEPQLCYGIPSCSIEPLRAAADRDLAEGLKQQVNAWATETDWKQSLREITSDTIFGFGVSKVTVVPRGDYNAGGLAAVDGDFQQRPNYPAAVRVDPRDFFIDPQARTFNKARFIGHTYERDLEDVQADQRLDPELVKSLVSPDVVEPLGGTDVNPDDRDATDRKRLTLFELYLPEHGKMLTLCRTQSGSTSGSLTILRNEDYFGPDEGPYTLWGLSTVTGELIPISPIQALWDGFNEINIHARAAGVDANTFKQLGLYDINQAEDAKKINAANNGELVGVSNAAGVKTVQIGGTSEGRLDWITYLRNRMEDQLGFTDAQRGAANSKTATANQIAANNSDIRIDAFRDIFRDCVVSVYRKVAWYFWHDPSIGQLESLDPKTGRSMTFVAGPWDGGYVKNQWVDPEPQRDFTDVNLAIEARSMQKVDDALEQKRAQDFFVAAQTLAGVVGPQNINWRGVVDDYGEAFNRKDLSKRIFIDQFGQAIAPDPLSMPPHVAGQPNPDAQAQPGSNPMPQTPAPSMATPGGVGIPGLMANARGPAMSMGAA